MLFKNKQDWHLSNTMADAVKQVLKPAVPFLVSAFYINVSVTVPSPQSPSARSSLLPRPFVQISEFCLSSHEPITHAAPLVLSLWQPWIFSCSTSRLPFSFVSQPQRMIQQSEYHACSSGRAQRKRNERWPAWHNYVIMLFTWGVLWSFCVHARRAAAFFAPSTLRAGLGVANDWNLFLSTLFA